MPNLNLKDKEDLREASRILKRPDYNWGKSCEAFRKVTGIISKSSLEAVEDEIEKDNVTKACLDVIVNQSSEMVKSMGRVLAGQVERKELEESKGYVETMIRAFRLFEGAAFDGSEEGARGVLDENFFRVITVSEILGDESGDEVLRKYAHTLLAGEPGKFQTFLECMKTCEARYKEKREKVYQEMGTNYYNFLSGFLESRGEVGGRWQELADYSLSKVMDRLEANPDRKGLEIGFAIMRKYEQRGVDVGKYRERLKAISRGEDFSGSGSGSGSGS